MPIKFSTLPSFERLNELLTHNSEDGRLRWRVDRSNVKAGSIAGYMQTDKNGRRDWMIKVDHKIYTSARIIWALYHRQDPGILTIDHIDRDPLNNRIANLRLATAHEQNMNTNITSPTTAIRYLGLSMCSRKNRRGRPRWQGKIRISGRYYYFGSVVVDSINDPAPDWFIARATHIYAMRDDSGISDIDLIEEIDRLKSQRK